MSNHNHSFFSKVGVALSSVCVIHCLSVPLVLLFLPVFAEFFTEQLERILVLSIIPFSLIGFIPTWMKHKNKQRLAIYLGALALIIGSQFMFHADHAVYEASVGSALLLDHPELLRKPILTFIGALGLAWVTYKNNAHTHDCNNKHHKH